MRLTQCLYFCFFLLHAGNVLSQSRITGSLQDSLARPVSFCALGLFRGSDTSLVKGSLADESGNFIFEGIAAGSYFIKINHPGFSPLQYGPIQADSSGTLQLEPIRLKSQGVFLKEVGITAIKAPLEFVNGNVIMNVDNSPLTAGNSAFDLLSRLPGVLVDNTNISIQGKSGVKLYLDNRPQPFSGLQLINFLKSLPASSIEKIEIIVHPSAKYDAAGNAGIIHIRSKKIKVTGSSGSANASYSQGFYANVNGGFSLNYKGKKAAVFTSMNGSEGPRHNVSRFDKTITYNGQTTRFNQENINTYNNRNMTINLGADWYVNKKNTIGVKAQVIPGYCLTRNRSTILTGDSSRQLQFNNTISNDWVYVNYNVNAEHLLDTLGGKLSFSADYYGPYFDNYPGVYENRAFGPAGQLLAAEDFKNNNRLSTEILTARMDLEKKLPKSIQLGAGLKSSCQEVLSDYLLVRKNNGTGEYLPDSNFTNTFRYRENISAAYLNLETTIKKIQVQAGLRAEHTLVNAQSLNDTTKYHRNYLNLFPNLSLSYQPSQKHQFSVSYNKRIDRPDYNSFNPFRWFITSLTSSVGNPYLLPAYTHNVNLLYAFNSSIYNNLTFTRTNNMVTGYASQNNATGETIFRSGNLNHFNFLHYSFFMRKNIRNWWVLSFNLAAYYISYEGQFNGKNYFSSTVPHYEWLNSVFILPRHFKVEMTAYYWSPWLGVGNKYKSRSGLTVGVKRSFLNDALNCSLTLNDVFFSETFRSTSDFEGQSWQVFDSNDTRRLNVSVSYTFGKLKIEQRNGNSGDEEKKRLGK